MTLGSMIEEARKAAGFSLAELASATNIRATVLNQIEKDDFSNCGGHTYARGHIRNIAIALKADQAELLRVFDDYLYSVSWNCWRDANCFIKYFNETKCNPKSGGFGI